MNAARTLEFLLAAVEHARHASARVVSMVRIAIAAFLARVAIQQAAAA